VGTHFESPSSCVNTFLTSHTVCGITAATRQTNNIAPFIAAHIQFMIVKVFCFLESYVLNSIFELHIVTSRTKGVLLY